MRSKKNHSPLPIGRTARIAFEIDSMRAACCKAAASLTQNKSFDEQELEECARLDDALARAHVLLKNTVRDIMLSRIGRRSRAK